MRHTTLEVINDEHQALSAMLRSLSMLLAQARREKQMPDFGVLRTMLFYVDEYPEKLHHRKESELLFPVVRQRCPELAPTLDRLDRDHATGERAIRDLEHELLAFEAVSYTHLDVYKRQAHVDDLGRVRVVGHTVDGDARGPAHGGDRCV